ncbi:alpha/beta hydrolase [Fertoebacter nigrum]|uniref:Alpha/beta hydrolase n=1 Tax=Fertoeibacter niger TaxID=2656921 RepID=A0A8X8GUR7_9RHOB|nr:alpha/beta hydrolase [Fertoeibacter niger]NUB44718.1 alpha/beta hydrolase [Fertoeibacter niger]
MMRQITSNGITLMTQSFGEAGNPAMLLVMGATASMLGWPDELCAALADSGLFVIRFDHRDTGQSTTFAPGGADYAVEDMADDVITILDGYGIARAHLVGMSLGGYIAQMVAVTHPARIQTLTLIASEPLGWDEAPLPHISQAFLDHFGALGTLDWSDTQAVAAFLLESDRLCAGNAAPFDEVRARARIAQVLERSDSPASMFNHGALTMRQDWAGRFREISCPVLVVHGEVDPILPPENGRAIAGGIAGATLVILPGIGHEIPAGIIPELAQRIAVHACQGPG